jgi:hypothetical protein
VAHPRRLREIAIEASAIIRRWSSHYPADGRFRVFLFDDIARRPAETLQAILGFVGADLSKPGQLPPDHNPKSKVRKMQMPGTIRDILIELSRRRCSRVCLVAW